MPHLVSLQSHCVFPRCETKDLRSLFSMLAFFSSFKRLFTKSFGVMGVLKYGAYAASFPARSWRPFRLVSTSKSTSSQLQYHTLVLLRWWVEHGLLFPVSMKPGLMAVNRIPSVLYDALYFATMTFAAPLLIE